MGYTAAFRYHQRLNHSLLLSASVEGPPETSVGLGQWAGLGEEGSEVEVLRGLIPRLSWDRSRIPMSNGFRTDYSLWKEMDLTI